jgi:F-type H+-transporting ATPase subunit b
MLDFQLSTFIFQMINFVILLAALSWFLFRPLLRVMRQRQSDIEAHIQEADDKARKADEERQELAEALEQARIQATDLLTQARTKANHAREQMLEQTRHEVAELTQEARNRIQEQERATQQRLQERLSEAAVGLAGNLIREAAGPSLHQSLVEQLIVDEAGLGAEETDLLKQALARNHQEIVVEVAYPAGEDLEGRISQGLCKALGTADPLNVDLRVEPSLIAGARIMIGTVAVDLSLSRTLKELVESLPSAGESNGSAMG